jgi:peptidoglycan/LPS O-acetylase OafA/YrhL
MSELAKVRATSEFTTPTGRLESIDFLRGCAAMGVVLLHVALSGSLPHAPLWIQIIYGTMLQGWWGVPLFFVISGFCIHLRWAKQQAGKQVDRLDLFDFWKRRLYRLYPPYLIVLSLSMLMVYGTYRIGRELPLVAKYPSPQPYWMLYDFFLHVTMLHGFFPFV